MILIRLRQALASQTPKGMVRYYLRLPDKRAHRNHATVCKASLAKPVDQRETEKKSMILFLIVGSWFIVTKRFLRKGFTSYSWYWHSLEFSSILWYEVPCIFYYRLNRSLFCTTSSIKVREKWTFQRLLHATAKHYRFLILPNKNSNQEPYLFGHTTPKIQLHFL